MEHLDKNEKAMYAKTIRKITTVPKEIVMILPFIKTREEAIEDKLKRLNSKIMSSFLKTYEIGEMRDVWVPYQFMTYEFDIKRRTMFNKTGKLDIHGKISLVFDLNEFHAFNYDEVESGKLNLIEQAKSNMIGVILDPSRSEKEVQKKAEWYINNRLLRRIYSMECDLSLIESRYFYRGAVEIKVYSRGVENVRYAYYDQYSTNIEHIFGLKYRLG